MEVENRARLGHLNVLSGFTEFVREHEVSLRHALIASCGGQLGLDATADALAYGWEHWDRVGSMENPVGYLYKVGRNRARRSRNRRRILFAGESVDGVPDIEPGLPAALDGLSSRQRTAVVLVYCYQWSHSEVGEVLGVSKATVQKHAERGLVRLRRELGEGV
jgi:RNA polymerase sigma-70 factor (ECF subfamily)